MNSFFATRFLIGLGIFMVICNVAIILSALFMDPPDDLEDEDD